MTTISSNVIRSQLRLLSLHSYLDATRHYKVCLLTEERSLDVYNHLTQRRLINMAIFLSLYRRYATIWLQILCVWFSKDALKLESIHLRVKDANMIQMHKKERSKTKRDMDQSHLSDLCKQFEKIMFDAIYCHLCENGTISRSVWV